VQLLQQRDIRRAERKKEGRRKAAETVAQMKDNIQRKVEAEYLAEQQAGSSTRIPKVIFAGTQSKATGKKRVS
jgi:hypothetical protein